MIKKILFTLLLFTATLTFSQKSLTKLSAAPNPFVNNTNIKFDSTKDQAVFLTVKNVLGKTVYNKKHKIKKGKNSIPFSKDKLKSGMYIYIIRNNEELITKRFVIK
jgi:hypothetical protein